jgi:hypothetical protein
MPRIKKQLTISQRIKRFALGFKKLVAELIAPNPAPKPVSSEVKPAKKRRRKQRKPMSDDARLNMMIAIEARKAQGLTIGRPVGVKNKPKRKPYTKKVKIEIPESN